jgi:hypothetical protein
MCAPFGVNLQRGMNYRLRNNESLILMSVRRGAPYEDKFDEGGRVIVYEGHDVPRNIGVDPKRVDQTEHHPSGRLTQNGLFMEAVRRFQAGKAEAERVRVFEKIRDGIWVYNGLFELVDGWHETKSSRQVFKFRLQLLDEVSPRLTQQQLRAEIDNDRLIPSAVKLEVWKRDNGCCAKCGSRENLHFDHIMPYSRGGSSKNAANIQILCGKHNLEKRDNIE